MRKPRYKDYLREDGRMDYGIWGCGISTWNKISAEYQNDAEWYRLCHPSYMYADAEGNIIPPETIDDYQPRENIRLVPRTALIKSYEDRFNELYYKFIDACKLFQKAIKSSDFTLVSDMQALESVGKEVNEYWNMICKKESDNEPGYILTDRREFIIKCYDMHYQANLTYAMIMKKNKNRTLLCAANANFGAELLPPDHAMYSGLYMESIEKAERKNYDYAYEGKVNKLIPTERINEINLMERKKTRRKNDRIGIRPHMEEHSKNIYARISHYRKKCNEDVTTKGFFINWDPLTGEDLPEEQWPMLSENSIIEYLEDTAEGGMYRHDPKYKKIMEEIKQRRIDEVKKKEK